MRINHLAKIVEEDEDLELAEAHNAETNIDTLHSVIIETLASKDTQPHQQEMEDTTANIIADAIDQHGEAQM